MKNWLNTAKDWLKKFTVVTPDVPQLEPVKPVRPFSLLWNKAPTKCIRFRTYITRNTTGQFAVRDHFSGGHLEPSAACNPMGQIPKPDSHYPAEHDER